MVPVEEIVDIGDVSTPRGYNDRDENNSTDDDNRRELLWEDREENLIMDITRKCEAIAIRHHIKGAVSKRLYAFWGVPGIILPVVVASLNEYLEEKYYASVAMLTAAICNTIGTFFNYGKMSQKHFDIAGKYEELSQEVQMEMCKPKRHRIACDVYLQKTVSKFNNLNSNAPNL